MVVRRVLAENRTTSVHELVCLRQIRVSQMLSLLSHSSSGSVSGGHCRLRTPLQGEMNPVFDSLLPALTALSHTYIQHSHSSSLPQKKVLMKKGAGLNCLTVHFFLLVLGNLSSHSDLLPGMGKRVDARTFSCL